MARPAKQIELNKYQRLAETDCLEAQQAIVRALELDDEK